MNATPHESRTKFSPMQFPQSHEKGECPFRLRLNCGAALTFFLSLAGKGLSVFLAQHDGGYAGSSDKKRPRRSGALRGPTRPNWGGGTSQRSTTNACLKNTSVQVPYKVWWLF